MRILMMTHYFYLKLNLHFLKALFYHSSNLRARICPAGWRFVRNLRRSVITFYNCPNTSLLKNQTKHPSPKISIQVVSGKKSLDFTSTCSVLSFIVLHDTKNKKLEANFLLKQWEMNNERINNSLRSRELALKLGFHEAYHDHDNDWFQAKTKRLERWMRLLKHIIALFSVLWSFSLL